MEDADEQAAEEEEDEDDDADGASRVSAAVSTRATARKRSISVLSGASEKSTKRRK